MSREQEPGANLVARLSQPAPRRDFLKWSGAGALAAVGLAACSDGTDVRSITEVVTDTVRINPPPPTTYPSVTLNFGNNFGILNYAYALEQLEAAFYTQVVASPSFSAFAENERRVLTDLRDHEIAHREFFERAIPALGGTAIPELTPDFDAVDFNDRDSILVTARMFEDLGVAAYNGAGPLFSNDATGQTLLTVAAKIVSVEARHAAAIRSILAPFSGSFAPSAFDEAFTPQQVLAAAQPFIRNRVTATNVQNI